MATSYPDNIDSFPSVSPTGPLNVPPHDQQHNNANDAIVALQTELGTNPSGSEADVKARFEKQAQNLQDLAESVDEVVAVAIDAPYFLASGADETLPDGDSTPLPFVEQENVGGFSLASSDTRIVVPVTAIYLVTFSMSYTRSSATRLQFRAEFPDGDLWGGRPVIFEGVNEVGGTVWAGMSGSVALQEGQSVAAQALWQGSGASSTGRIDRASVVLARPL